MKPTVKESLVDLPFPEDESLMKRSSTDQIKQSTEISNKKKKQIIKSSLKHGKRKHSTKMGNKIN